MRYLAALCLCYMLIAAIAIVVLAAQSLAGWLRARRRRALVLRIALRPLPMARIAVPAALRRSRRSTVR